MKSKVFTFIASVLVGFCCAESSQAAILFEDDFDNYADSPANHGWDIPSSVVVESGDSPEGGRCLKFTISENGTAQYWSNFDPNPNGTFEDGYIAFWAKQEGHTDGASGGVKWLKLFSSDYPATYANVTWGQTYETGIFGSVSAGSGYGPTNDTQVGYRYSGLVSAGNWLAGTGYSAGYTSGYGTNQIYSCRLSHTASSDNRPGIGAEW
ncbi:MAG: hypothetical protein QG620_928, partial [Patescibacteria group bacterium]|nr:hypothetical protein [Patescibacteria group bacterium]